MSMFLIQTARCLTAWNAEMGGPLGGALDRVDLIVNSDASAERMVYAINTTLPYEAHFVFQRGTPLPKGEFQIDGQLFRIVPPKVQGSYR